MGYIKFLGTAGARFVMIKQLRASGGIWISHKDTNIIVDPGPGSLVKALNSRPSLKPAKLDGIILTHKHIDHSNDVNVMVEAMTEGGNKKKGILLAPKDCFGKGGVIFDYLKGFLERTEYLKEGRFKVEDIIINVPVKMVHSVETYGLEFDLDGFKIGIITDTGFFKGLKKQYKRSDLLVINVVLYDKKENIEHLCLDQAKEIISSVKPKKVVLTHFGMGMIKNDLRSIEERINSEFKDIQVQCAFDGMKIEY